MRLVCLTAKEACTPGTFTTALESVKLVLSSRMVIGGLVTARARYPMGTVV